jgi:hypothetical protein
LTIDPAQIFEQSNQLSQKERSNHYQATLRNYPNLTKPDMMDAELVTHTSLNTSLVALLSQNATSLTLASIGMIPAETNKDSQAAMPTNKDWTTRKADLMLILNDVELLLAEL